MKTGLLLSIVAIVVIILSVVFLVFHRVTVTGTSDIHLLQTKFDRGVITWAKTIVAGPSGGAFEVNIPDKQLTYISVYVNIPPGAVSKETRFSVGFDSGTFTPAIGEASGYILVLDAGATQSFKQPISVSVQSLLDKGVPVGYSLEENGAIELIESIWDRKSGKLTFYSFRPLTFTWVYATWTS